MPPPPPLYGASFHCIGADCEDTCCQNWGIPLDRNTYEKYQAFPSGDLAALTSQYVQINPAPVPDSLYATIQLTPSGFCPFLSDERLCNIQKEHGSAYLGATCSIYPRILNKVDEQLEVALTLSCPEAARQVLLDPDFTHPADSGASHSFRTDQFTVLASQENSPLYKPFAYFHDIRALLVEIVRHRTLPLPDRLILIGELYNSLSDITDVTRESEVPGILQQVRLRLTNPDLPRNRPAAQPALQLDIVLQLTAQRLRSGVNGNRFRETFQSFLQGIHYAQDSTPEDDLRHYTEAGRLFLQPFLDQHPHILENYLLNYIYRSLFPIGRAASVHYTPQTINDEYLLLVTSYLWINGLLTGIAGLHRENFSTQHVIQAMQSFARAVEHDPAHAVQTVAYIRSRGVNTVDQAAGLLQTH